MTPEQIAEFKNDVQYFWVHKGDAERYVGWSEEACAEAWPEFLFVWKQYKTTEKILDVLCREHST